MSFQDDIYSNRKWLANQDGKTVIKYTTDSSFDYSAMAQLGNDIETPDDDDHVIGDGSASGWAYAISQIEKVANIDFVEAATAEDADLGLLLGEFHPPEHFWNSATIARGLRNYTLLGTDGLPLDPTPIQRGLVVTTSLNPFNDTAMHELMHVLGLDHPGHRDGYSNAYVTDLTLMRYATGLNEFKAFITPMLYDIVVLQELYGAKFDDVDSTYSLGASKYKQTIWDGGGTDEITAEAYTGDSSVTIDLREGIDPNTGLPYATNINGIFGLTSYMAYGANIENATGSKNNDVIYGNNSYEAGTYSHLANLSFNGNNHLKGLAGDDTVYGLSGDDTIEGGLGRDVMNGGEGIDTLSYQSAALGAAFDIADTSGNGTGGDAAGDSFFSFEKFIGSDYNDKISIHLFTSNITIEGGLGQDEISLKDFSTGVTINLGAGTIAQASGTVSFTGIEKVIGTNLGDTIIGSGNNDEITGGTGNDQLNGGAGADKYHFKGVFGDDVVIDNGAADSLYIGGHLLTGEAVQDSVTGAYELGGYILTKAGSNLVISSGNNSVTLTNWDAGDYGITLSENQEEPELPIANPLAGLLNDLVNALAMPVVKKDPLILDIQGDGFNLISAASSNIYFDYNGDGIAERTGWVAPSDGFLVLDKDNNGTIDGINELFGDLTQSGFEELSHYDETIHGGNADGKIDFEDAVFSELNIWQDLDSDGVADAGEVKNISEYGILQLSLNAASANLSIAGNIIRETATYIDSSGTPKGLGEAFLSVNFYDSNLSSDAGTLFGTDPALLALPLSRGYGEITSLQKAMAGDATLKTLVQNLVNTTVTASSATTLENQVTAILLRWTGADQVTGNPSAVFDLQKLTALEALFGVDANTLMNGNALTAARATQLQNVWNNLEDFFTARLLWQGPFKSLVPDATYDVATDTLLLNSPIADILERFDASGWKSAAMTELLFHMLSQSAGESSANGNIGDITAQITEHFSDYVASFLRPEPNVPHDGHSYVQGDAGNNNFVADARGAVIHGNNGNDGIYIFDEKLTITVNVNSSSGSSSYTTTYYTNNGHFYLYGDAGNDTIQAAYGWINAFGGEGADTINITSPRSAFIDGGNGNDYLQGSESNDTILGGAGNDYINARGTQNASDLDVVYGGSGNDTIHASGAARIWAGDGDDSASASGSSTIYGGNGNDYVGFNGLTAGHAFVDLGEGDNSVGGGISNAAAFSVDIIAGDGNDSLNAYVNSGHSTIDLGNGNNIIQIGANYNELHEAVIAIRTGNGDDSIQLNYFREATIISGAGADTIIASGDGLLLINSGDGDDSIQGGLSTNVINAGNGNDFATGMGIISGEEGNDSLNGNGENTVLNGGVGNDFITASYFAVGNGGDGDDTLQGSDYWHDLEKVGLHGEDGNDSITGYKGNDDLYGGAGADTVYGGANNDYIDGGIGNDLLHGDDGNDAIIGGNGDDIVTGDAGNDSLTAGAGNDSLDGGNGNDTLSGMSGNNTMEGGTGDDVILGGTGNDSMNGGSDNDTINAGQGNDTITGGSGADIFIIAPVANSTTTITDFQQGNDIINLTDAGFTSFNRLVDLTITNDNGDSVISLGNGQSIRVVGKAGYSWTEYDFRFSGGIISSDTDDSLIGTVGNETIYAGYGYDTVYGGAGNDLIYGDNHNDTLYGAEGDDTLVGGQGEDRLFGGTGSDHFVIVQEPWQYDTVEDFTRGQDKIDLSNMHYILSMDDLAFSNENGFVVISYSYAQYAFRVNGQTASQFTASDFIFYTPAAIEGTANGDSLVGTAEQDSIYGYAGNDTIQAGDGNDTVYGGEGNDSIQGEGGANKLYGDAGNDSLYGSYLNDTLVGGDGDDVLNGGTAENQLTGGAGADRFVIAENAYYADMITDFAVGTDSIDLSNESLGIYSLADLAISDYNGSVIIGLKYGQTIQLQGVSASSLTAGSFHFALPPFNLVNGTAGADSLAGVTNDENKIYGNDGDDTIAGFGYADSLYGGNGNDVIQGGAGYNSLYGEAGNDSLYGGDEGNFMEGGDGDDFFQAGISTDRFYGGNGSDTVSYADRTTNVTIYLYGTRQYGADRDEFYSIENVIGGSGNDYLYGSDENNKIAGGDGNNTLTGGNGADSFIFTNQANAADIISDFTIGTDIIDLNNAGFSGVTGFSNLNLSNADGNTVISFANGHSITLNNINYTQLSASDFIFYTAPVSGNQPINGTSGADSLNGSANADTISGADGNDTIHAGEGDDSVSGDGGNDSLYGGNGNDAVLGGTGLDELYGESGNDALDGGDDNDLLYGGDGDDSLLGGTGSDVLESGTGADSANGGDGNDSIFGNAGNDTLYGGGNEDEIHGEADNDLIFGNDGNDSLLGENGDDSINGGAHNDTIFGGAGIDLLLGGDNEDALHGEDGNDALYGENGSDVLYGDAGDDYASGGADNDSIYGGIGADSLLGDENDDVLHGEGDNDTLLGGTGADALYGDDGVDSLDGGAGNDSLFGGIGNDILAGGDNEDALHGEQGNDSLVGGNGYDLLYGDDGNDSLEGGDLNDTIYGGTGSDLISGGANEDFLAGEAGTDTLYGWTGNDSLFGGDGADLLLGDEGNDSVDGGADNDSLFGYTGEDTMLGGLGNDVLSGEDGNDNLTGGDGDDTIYGGNGTDVIYGDDGRDYLEGGDGNDTIYGGAGLDTLHGGAGNDSLDGGSKNDYLYGDDGNDIINANWGSDTITGGAGADTMGGGLDGDTFRYTSLTESTDSARDVITDFTHLADHINLAGLGFTGIQAGAASGTVLGYSVVNGHTIIDDANSSFSIDLTGSITLTNDDFIFS